MGLLLLLLLIAFFFAKTSLSETPLSKRAFLALLVMPIFFIVFLWGFFDGGVANLGLNMTLFLGLTLLFFIRVARQKGVEIKKQLPWILPLVMIAVSYALFENDYIRTASIFIFFFWGIFFAGNAAYGDTNDRTWNFHYLARILLTNVLAFGRIAQPFRQLMNYCKPKGLTYGNGVTWRIFLGLILFLGLSGAVIVPLLSAADSQFGAFFSEILRYLWDIIDFFNFPKILVALTLFAFFGALGSLWLNAPQVEATAKEAVSKRNDAIVTGIVLGGILFLYIIFLLLQLNHLWMESLPIDFQKTEYEVKSGFWQLFILTLINITFFITLYAKDLHRTVRLILNTFVVSSLFLVVSAGQRVFLYNYFYGLSHEKFFAAYTVAFCLGVFVWFVRIIIVSSGQSNILRSLAFASLWAYAFATWLPLESMMFSANTALSKHEGSRLDLANMTAFSGDILAHVSENKTELSLQERNYREEEGGYDGDVTELDSWQYWLDRQCRQSREKKWYEQSVAGVRNALLVSSSSVCSGHVELDDDK